MVRFCFIPFQSGYGNLDLDCPACECHVNGSANGVCHKLSGQCECKLGVEGIKCDQCQEEFFGLSEEFPDGCEGKCGDRPGSLFVSVLCLCNHDKLTDYLPWGDGIDYSQTIRSAGWFREKCKSIHRSRVLVSEKTGGVYGRTER